MTEPQAESQFFGGMDYLRRLDELLSNFNRAFCENTPSIMFTLLVSYYTEIQAYMTEKQAKEQEARYMDMRKMCVVYNEEVNQNNLNRSYARLPGNQHLPRPPIEIKEQEVFKFALVEWRMELQAIAKKSGLVMEDKADPRKAMFGDGKR